MITGVSRRDIKVQLAGVLRGARTACVGLGYGALVLASGLALWGWLIATPSDFEGDWDPREQAHGYGWHNNFPAGPAASVIGITVALIAVSAYAWVLSRRSTYPTRWLSTRLLAACAVIYFAALSIGLPAFYRLVMDNYPVTTAVPMVVASWLLASGGAVAVLASIPLPRLTRKAVPVVAGGVALGVIAAVVLALQAVQAGDDRRHVDATVAPTVDIPDQPTTLGQRRFSLKVSDWRGSPSNQPDVQVAAAGAGFVVFHKGQITGYGSDGKERWHYRRTGPGRVSVTGARVFDEGRTVVAAVTAGTTDDAQVLVGLDAVTGQQLWSARSTLREPESASFHPFRNMHGVETLSPSPFLIADRYSGARWTRFDTRTGKPLWTIDSPVGHDCHGDAADTQSRIVTATVCSANGKADMGLVALDPSSGQRLWQPTLTTGIPDPPGRRYMLFVTPAGLDGVALSYGSPAWSTTQSYANVVTHEMRDLGPHDKVIASAEPGDAFIVQHRGESGATELSLYDSHGLRRCALPPGLALSRDIFGFSDPYLVLANKVVVYDMNAHKLQTLDRNTCAVLATQQTSSVPDWLAAAPGVVLVERIAADGTYVDGYT
jgi:hypothetical protein